MLVTPCVWMLHCYRQFGQHKQQLEAPAERPALVFLFALPFCWPAGGCAVPGAALRTAFTLMGSTCMQKEI